MNKKRKSIVIKSLSISKGETQESKLQAVNIASVKWVFDSQYYQFWKRFFFNIVLVDLCKKKSYPGVNLVCLVLTVQCSCLGVLLSYYYFTKLLYCTPLNAVKCKQSDPQRPCIWDAEQSAIEPLCRRLKFYRSPANVIALFPYQTSILELKLCTFHFLLNLIRNEIHFLKS